MHDCHGKPIVPFCRVRAATVEELSAAGHPEASYPTTLSPAEKIALPGQYQSDTCNVYLVNDVAFSPSQPLAAGMVELKLVTSAWPQLATARSLVVL